MSGEEARAAWHRRKGKPYGPWPEPTETSDEPTTAAIRQKEEFEQRRGHALAVARRRSWLKRHKVFLLKAVHGVEVKP
jgi:hypothetical protein